MLKDFRMKLTPSAKRKPEDKTPHVITLQGLRHYTQMPKRSEYELTGINPGARQLALSNFDETKMQDLSVTIYPGELKMPRPKKEFEQLLAELLKSK